LTIFPIHVDGRLTALCDAVTNKTAAEQVKRMNAQEPGQEPSPVDETPTHTTYRQEHWSYLLRLWRAGGDGSWRASLQSIPSGERHMFADLDSLLAFLFALSQ
jgi:hypothetical protein